MAQVPAFPGAEGHGCYTTGGRGGKVVHVTNLNDSGKGSFREAVKGSEKKTVVFDVAGIIALKSNLKIGANTTIAGQTAPGEGITVRYYTVSIGGDNCIIRFMRFRRGEERDVNDSGDAMYGVHHRNIIIDHCSFSWSIDESASFYDNRNFTMQWCTIGEPLCSAGHTKGMHGYGGIWGGKNASFHHNLFIHCNDRTPLFCGARYNWAGYDTEAYANTVLAERVDYRNNVIYNWGTGGTHGGMGGGFINIVNNYYKSGPATSKRTRVMRVMELKKASDHDYIDELCGLKSRIYIKGNYVAGYGANYDWNGVDYRDGSAYFTDTCGLYGQGTNALFHVRLRKPINAGSITTHNAVTAYDKVLTYSGASIAYDKVDSRFMHEVRDSVVTYVGSIESEAKYDRPGMIDLVADQGSYTLPVSYRPKTFDVDQDGMSDEWERANGLNPNDAYDANEYTLDKHGWYTNLEVYLHALTVDRMRPALDDSDDAVDHYWPGFISENGMVIPPANNPSGISDVKAANTVSSKYYNIQGSEVPSNFDGVVIRVDTYSDGRRSSRKIYKN